MDRIRIRECSANTTQHKYLLWRTRESTTATATTETKKHQQQETQKYNLIDVVK